MDDSSLIRIHRLKSYRSSRSLYFMSYVLCEMSESFLSSGPVIFRIKLNPYIAVLMFVCNTVCQILKSVKSLASFPDENSHMLALHINAERAVRVNTGLNLNIH